MIGNLEPEERIMSQPTINEQVASIIEKLGWSQDDEIRVKIGGVANSGIHQAEGANPKWAKPFGTVSYHNDAFIVIENATRSPVVPSQPNPDLKAHHE